MNVEKTSTGNKIYGIVSGIVKMINSDGTYKVWIPGVYNSEFYPTPEKLPSAKLMYMPFGGDAITFSFGGPLIEDTKVMCFFDNGEITKPIIIGKYLSEETYQELATQTQNNLNRQVCIKNKNSKIVMYENGEIEIMNFSKPDLEATPLSKIKMDSSGDISISGKNITINASETFNVGAKSILTFSIYDTIISTLKNVVTKCTSCILGYMQVVKAKTIHTDIPYYTLLAGFDIPYVATKNPDEIDAAHEAARIEWEAQTEAEIAEAKANGTFNDGKDASKMLIEQNTQNMDVVKEAEFMRLYDEQMAENASVTQKEATE